MSPVLCALMCLRTCMWRYTGICGTRMWRTEVCLFSVALYFRSGVRDLLFIWSSLAYLEWLPSERHGCILCFSKFRLQHPALTRIPRACAVSSLLTEPSPSPETQPLTIISHRDRPPSDVLATALRSPGTALHTGSTPALSPVSR